MQCQYGTDRNGIDIDGGRKAGGQERRGGKERLEQMSIPPPLPPPTLPVVQKLFPATELLRNRHWRRADLGLEFEADICR